MSKYRIVSNDGQDVLCMYKADDDFKVGFMGKAAAELVSQGNEPFRYVEYMTHAAALCSAGIYGGKVEPTFTLNGGW